MLISESNLSSWSKFTLPLQPLCEAPSWSFHLMALRSPCQPALGVAPGASLKTKGSDKILSSLLQGRFSLLKTFYCSQIMFLFADIYVIRTDIILSITALFIPWEQNLSCSKETFYPAFFCLMVCTEAALPCNQALFLSHQMRLFKRAASKLKK